MKKKTIILTIILVALLAAGMITYTKIKSSERQAFFGALSLSL